jgi:predicted alpha-1,6-mannanase (GH76 family)
MYQDGLRIAPGGDVVLESSIYTYNQGPVLGALLELGGEANLARAAALVAAVARNLTLPAPLMGRSATVLRCEGTGDGGLFTGILVRYLALAALDERLPAEARNTAAILVNDTAEAFWEGRRIVSAQEPLARKGGRILFSTRPELPARRSYPAGAAVELSTQLQAWMVLEAAASIAGRSGLPEEAADAATADEGTATGAQGTGAEGPTPGATHEATPAESRKESPAGN